METIAIITLIVGSVLGAWIAFEVSTVSNSVDKLNGSLYRLDNKLGKIGDFLWPQHELTKRVLKTQDDAKKMVDETEKPATARQLDELVEVLQGMASKNETDENAVDEFRQRLTDIEDMLADLKPKDQSAKKPNPNKNTPIGDANG